MNVINSLKEIVGSQNVNYDVNEMILYSHDMSFVKGETPQCIVKPETVKELQKIIDIARKNNCTLVPISSTGNHHNGDTVPTAKNAIMVDLSQHKKILNINRTHRMAVIEPGVTYSELIESLKPEGMTISLPLRPRKEKSVLTSVLEVEPRINANHQWNYFDPLRCTEVTWGDGNNMYTGEAGGSPKDLETQWKNQRWQINGMGPNAFDFVRMLTSAQGTMGIVTWASLRCEISPTINETFVVSSDSIEKLTELANSIIKKRFSDSLFIVNRTDATLLLADSQNEIENLKEYVGKWNMFIGISGREFLPELRFDSQKKSIEDIVEDYGVKLKDSIYRYDSVELANRFATSCEGTYWKEMEKGSFADIFFITTIGRVPLFIEEIKSIAYKNGYDASNIGIYVQPQNCGTSVHLEFTFTYDPKNNEEIDIVKKIYKDGSIKMSEIDAYYSRPYGIWSQLQLSKDPVSYDVLHRLKNIFDPDDIMNRGKITLMSDEEKGVK